MTRAFARGLAAIADFSASCSAPAPAYRVQRDTNTRPRALPPDEPAAAKIRPIGAISGLLPARGVILQ